MELATSGNNIDFPAGEECGIVGCGREMEKRRMGKKQEQESGK